MEEEDEMEWEDITEEDETEEDEVEEEAKRAHCHLLFPLQFSSKTEAACILLHPLEL